jgi:hypothetical protein
VNTAVDEIIPADGLMSLREAITAAAATDTIVFDPSLTGSTIHLALGQLTNLAKNLNIQGLGADNLAVSGEAMFRVFDILGGTVIISGLTIENGNALTGDGGGVRNFGSLTLEADTFINNSSIDLGGGFANEPVGTALVSDCTFTANSATANGGGIENFDGKLTVEDSTLFDNSALNGGGIRNTGTATVNDCTLFSNFATVNGGGISNTDTLYVDQCTLFDNHADGSGGGIRNTSNGTATVVFSSITGNSATTGGGISNAGTLYVGESDISGNFAIGALGNGGGIYNTGTLNVEDSSLSGNSAASGGAIYNAVGATATVSDSTITSNIATLEGGGIDNFGTLFVTKSIISGNSPDDLNNHSTGTATLNNSQVDVITNTGLVMVS